jgi:uncharacterized protein (TIGR00251 family)
VAEKAAGWIAVEADTITIRIVARPGSARRGILRVEPRGLVVALHSPPDQGRANDELVELLARSLRIPRSTISLLRGGTARAKTLRIATNHPQEAAEKLKALIPNEF